jgi:hypothetical protein
MGEALAQTERVVDPFEPGREMFDHLVEYLQSDEVHGMKHSDLERELEKQSCELMRRLLQGYLDSRVPGEAAEPVRDAQGDERIEKREHERDLETVFGTVSVERTGYLAEGAKSLHPLDGELNLPLERYSHEVRHRVAEEAAKNSFDETVESLHRHTGAHVPKRQAEELVVRAAQDFDAFYAEREAAAQTNEESGSILVLTSDGKGVVMRRQDLREATRKAAERRRHKLTKRLSKGEKKNAKRMATVASVYTIAPHVRAPHRVARIMAPVHGTSKQRRPRPEHKRVWASLEKEPEEVIDQAFREAARRDPDKEKAWVAVVDGNPHQLRLFKKYARRYGVTLTIVLDVIHVLGYLWKAGRAFSATLRELDTTKRKPVDTCADYLLKYKKHLAYDVYLAKGFPIATGVIEGACRHLIKDRMDLTGARWSLKGAEAVLRLRALRSSQDFDEYWVFHENHEHERNHADHYADGKVPFTKDRRANGRRHLNVVK